MKERALNVRHYVMAVLLVLAAFVFTFSLQKGEKASAEEAGETIESTEDFGQGGSDSITVKNTVKDYGYKIFKVFDAKAVKGNAAEGTKTKAVYTYSGNNSTFLSALGSSESPFSVSEVNGVKYVTLKSSANGNAVSNFIKAQANNLGDPAYEFTGNGGSVKITGLKQGYYYISTNVGSLVTLGTAGVDETVNEKNSLPSVSFQQSATADGSFSDGDLDLNTGDNVYYKITVTLGKGNDKEIVFENNFDGIEIDDKSLKVSQPGTQQNPQEVSEYTYEKNPDGSIKITLNEDYIGSFDDDDYKVIEITYSGKLTKDAKINNAEGDDDRNSSSLKYTYSDKTFPDLTLYDTTEDFQLKKVRDQENGPFLNGAAFRVYNDEACTDEVKFTKEAPDEGGSNGGAYRYYADVNGNDDIEVNSEEGVNIRGLKEGTYYLKEVRTPDGYEPADVTKIQVDKNKTNVITVVNIKNVLFPTTGGRGTLVFYVIGGLLVAGAAVTLIVRARKNKAGTAK